MHDEAPLPSSGHHDPIVLTLGVSKAMSMAFGRGRAARSVADIAGLAPPDRVVDIGCGPATAARVAPKCCARATGVDPSPAMLRLGRWLNSLRGRHNVILVEGTAEALPLPDESATVVRALSSVHHWTDRAAGFAEASRVLAPGGRVILAERLVGPGARGHAGHGVTDDQANELAVDLATAGFIRIHRQMRVAGHRALAVVSGLRPPLGEGAETDRLRPERVVAALTGPGEGRRWPAVRR